MTSGNGRNSGAVLDLLASREAAASRHRRVQRRSEPLGRLLEAA